MFPHWYLALSSHNVACHNVDVESQKQKITLNGHLYDNLECGACCLFEENQQHILECKVLNKVKSTEEIKYEILLNGSVEEKL